MSQNKKKKSRRRFLLESASGLAGIAILPSILRGETESESEASKQNRDNGQHKTIRRTLGRTGLGLPIVSMGVMNAENADLVRAALDAGIVHLDTAHAYQRGRNEEMVGGVIKDRPRDSFVVATKVAGSPLDRKTGFFTEDAKAGPFVEKFETSLKRLGLEYVDILYLHSVVRREAVLFEPYMTAMTKLKEQGKVRFIGVSTHRNEPEVLDAAVEGKIHDVVLTAYNFRQPHRDEVKAAVARAAEAGIGIVAMKTQAGAFWDKERQQPINMKAALKWVLQDENVHTTIPGITAFDQLSTNMSVMASLTLSPQETEDLQLGMKTGLPGLFCEQCGACVAQCGKDVDIPALMRSYMYVYGYRNLAAAQDTVQSMDLSALACESCDQCRVDCAMGFDVKNRIIDIARIRRVPPDFIA